jgi:peptide deformylase
MTLRKLSTIGHPVLRGPTHMVDRAEVETPEFQRFVDDLIETMRDAGGAGIAGNQVFEPVRVFAVEIADNPRYPYKPPFPLAVVVNPVLEVVGEETWLNNEGCLSVPGLRGDLPRFMHVRVTGWDRHGADIAIEATGLTAGTFQHEMDHLEGRLYVDRVADPRTFATWEQFDLHSRTAYLERIQPVIRRTTP